MDRFAIPKDLLQKIHNIHGEKADAWLAALPDLIAKYQQLWNIKILSFVKDLSYNVVAHAQSNLTAEKLIFKAVIPGKQFASEVQVLEYFAGHGCVQLLNYSLTDGVMLLEEAEPGTTLAEYSRTGRDEEAVTICADLIKSMHATQYPHSNITLPIRSLSEFTSVFANIKAFMQHNKSIFELAVVERAEQEFARLLATTEQNIILHGDLHHFNILKSKRSNWLAIDPHGVIGDPVFELVPFILNPSPGILKIANIKQIMQRRLALFAQQLGFDRRRIWGWSFSQSIACAGWMIEDKLDGWQEFYETGNLLLEIEFEFE